MQLHTLMYGKSKKRMHPIMTDELHKCENYMKAREHTVKGWHKIVVAEKNSAVWRQKSATVGGNRCESVGRVLKNGKTGGHAGYISKNGFNEHT